MLITTGAYINIKNKLFLIWSLLILFSGISTIAFGNGQTFTAKASANWNAAGTWTTVGAETYPGQDGSTNDIVIIPAFTVKINIVSAVCGSIEFTNATGKITFSAAGNQLTVGAGTSGQVYGTTAGTITVGTGILVINGFLNETTAIGVTVSTGSAILNASGTTTTMSAAATISLSNTGSITFNGIVNQSAGTITNTSASATGTINFNGNVTQSAASTISSTSSGTINFATGTTVTQSAAGTISCSKGALNFNGTCSVSQSAGAGTITCTGAGGTINFSSTSTFAQASSTATVSVTSSGTCTYANTAGFTHSGIIEVIKGTLIFDGPVTTNATGTIENITTAGTITFARSYTDNGTFNCSTKASVINFGGNVTCAAGATATFFATSTSTFTGNFTTSPTLTPPAASMTFGNVIISNTVVVALASSISVAGNWTNNSGVAACITGATSDVTFTGAAKTLGGTKGTTFPENLNIADGATITLNLPTSGNYIVTNNLNINTAVTATSLTLAASVGLTVSNNFTVLGGTAKTTITQNAGSTFTVTSSATINQPTAAVINNWSVGTGTATINGTLAFVTNNNTGTDIAELTVTTGTVTVNTASFTAGCTNDLCQKITLTTGVLNFTNAVNHTSGLISVTSGTINFSSDYNISGAHSVFSCTAAASINFGGNLNCSATQTPGISFFSTTSSAGSSTETFTGNSTVTSAAASPLTFGNLIINSGKTVTLSGAGATITVKGNWTDNGTFANGSVGVSYRANYTPQILTLSGTETFYNLTTNLGAAADVLQLGNNVLVTNALTMTTGDINANSYTLQVGNASNSVTTLTYTSGTVYGGTLARWWPSATAITLAGNNYGTFPVGIQGTTRKFTCVSAVNPTSAGLISVIHNDPSILELVTAASYTDNLGNAILDISQQNTTVTTDGSAGLGGTFTVLSTFGSFAIPAGSTINDYSLETYTSSVNGYAAGVTAANVANAGTVAAPILSRSGLVVGASVTAAHQGIANVYVCGTKNLETPIQSSTYYSVTTGTWNSTTEWSTTAGAVACPCVAAPVTTGNYIIQNGNVVTLSAAATAGNLQISQGEVTGANSLTVNGLISTTLGASAFISTTSTVSATGAVTLLGTGANATNGLTSGGALTVGANATLAVNGALTSGGNMTISGNTSVSGANTLTETGNTTINSPAILTTGTGVSSVLTGNLTNNGTLAIGTGTTTLSGTTVVLDGTGSMTGSGTFQIKNIITSFTIPVTANMNIAPEFLITGAITVLNNGNITLSNATNSLDGSVAGSVWQQETSSTLVIDGSNVPFSTAGSLDPSTCTCSNVVQYNGASNQTIATPTGSNTNCSCAAYDQLTASNAGIKSLAANIQVATAVTINGSAILNEGTFTMTDFGAGASLTMNGNASPEAGLQLKRSATGTYPELTGAYILTNGLVEIIDNAGTATLATANYYNLNVAGSSPFDLSQGGAGIIIADSLTVGSSTTTNTTTLSSIAGGMTVTTALSYISTGTTTLNANLTVPGNTTISAGSILLNAGTGILTAGNITIGGTGTLNDNGGNVNVSGNWTLNTGGTFTTTGQTSFLGSTNQTIGGTIATNTFNNLVINNTTACTTSPYPLAVTLNTPVTVTTNLLLQAGVVGTTAAHLLTIGTAAITATTSAGNSSSYIDGPIAIFGPNAVIFPVGNNGTYSQLGIQGSSGTIDNGVAATEFKCQYSLSASPNNTSSGSMDGNGNAGCLTHPGENACEGIDHTSGVEYWTLTLMSSNSPTEQCFVTLTSNNPTQSQISDLTDLCVAHDDVGVTGLWEDMGPDLSAGAIGASVSAESSIEFIDYSPITWGSKHGTNTLPIQLTSFTADCTNYLALLQWNTATEINNDHFTIERTQDGVHYETVTEVKGAGSSTTPHSYSAVDESPLTGTSYYRISQTDLDGKTTHLSTVAYIPCQNENAISSFAYNNSVKVEINSVESGPYTLTLYNTLGQAVYSKNVTTSPGLNNYTLNPTVNTGIYILRITGKDSVYTQKMIFGN